MIIAIETTPTFGMPDQVDQEKNQIPKKVGMNVQVVVYASERIDPDVRFTEEACEKLVKVPRVFLNTALKSCVNWAK